MGLVKSRSSITRFLDYETRQAKDDDIQLARVVGVVDHQRDGTMVHDIAGCRISHATDR